ncbi:probable aminopeptidase NPEPL1 isoform X3 [Cryptotermes secundus]|uniref:probable aminopeptidase NPEPL1 isoform X3 n=1 Tax=Cryptotermes secundus TaxID=105785 RepID=UPI000CD7BED6|nr:probable aminopeptidase NPEPL1 isoform X3 [Cryptotermes secundus]
MRKVNACWKYCENRTMSSAKLQFLGSLTQTDPHVHPVVIIGQVQNLAKIKFNDIKVKLEPRVTEEVYLSALASLHPSPTDTCSLYLNLATLAALPVKCSRHNAPSRAYAITKIVKSTTVGTDESVVIVCERRDVFASACAVARAYPLFSRKTSSKPSQTSNTTVRVEFLLVPSSECKAAGERNGNMEENLMLSSENLLCLESACTGVRLAARIVDAPCNEMNVDHFLQEVRTVADTLGVSSTVIRGEDLRVQGFGGIYGVGKAAAVSPALAVLSHTPPGATQTIAWVGKGIVYDTGGLSIKAKTAMPGMKRDCGGAAGILGAFYTAVRQGFTQNLHAVFCLAENAVGPNATRPDDIHVLHSGRTVEINNTDAEGRLVLADGVSYAQKDLKANIILDMATLTGAQGVSTGKYHGALLTNSEQWEEAAILASKLSGDLLFPIPYCPELQFSEFASAVADMKNSVAERSNAQPSCAGMFIGSHLGFDFQGIWIHVDMAYPVYVGERATGYGVALLVTLFGTYSQDQLLRSLGPKLKFDGTEIENACKRLKQN